MPQLSGMGLVSQVPRNQVCVHCAVASAVGHFHSGAATREKVLKKLSTPTGEHTRRASFALDKKRVRKLDLQATSKEKKQRQGEEVLQT